MKIELKRSVRKIFKDTNVEDISFKIIFTPEDVKETLELKELEKIRYDEKRDGYYNDKWEGITFIILLS